MKTWMPEQVKTGWQREEGGWRFYLKDGSGKCVSNDWYKDGERWYWFDGAGMMVHDVWYEYKGFWYYLGSDGAMVKDYRPSVANGTIWTKMAAWR